ncbi:MAG: glycoside hydrolase family 65 protein, partial [Halanaerobiales bacterium]|nr:glycoside hydrolase family 65 protein [Halanaerobiales bacterium]
MLTYHRLKSEKLPLYDYEPWQIREKTFTIRNNHHNETIFSLGNGYMGLRGTFEEDYQELTGQSTPGFYINGIYENEEIIYGEFAPKQPKYYQTMVNLMDWEKINLYIEDEKFNMLKGEIIDYERVLNIKKGYLKRTLVWESPQGKKVNLDIERIISFKHIHLGAIRYEVTPLNFSGMIRFFSELSGDVKNHHHLRNKRALSIIDKGIKDGKLFLLMKTNNSEISIGCNIENTLINLNDNSITKTDIVNKKEIKEVFEIDCKKGRSYQLEKLASFYSSKDIPKEDILYQCEQDINLILKNNGFSYLKKEQVNYLNNYWKYSDVQIEGDKSLQQAFRYNAFQILQSTGRNGETNIAAKGLSGEYYEGHYFWDTETYIIPYYIYSHPEIAKKLLSYRYKILDKARDNAQRMKLKGALFPWRTINGKEASGNFLGSTVQYHINADIAFAIYKYVKATDDKEFLYNKGAEILFETARMWLSLGHFEKLKDNKFCINEACGPDEYKPAANNNCYTNYMAKFNLQFAVEAYKELKAKKRDKLKEIKYIINLFDREVSKWEKASNNMYLPYNEKLKINPQDDSFIYKEDIDIENIPIDQLPLVNNWHPLTIWKYQVIKQADVILLMLFMGDK